MSTCLSPSVTANDAARMDDAFPGSQPSGVSKASVDERLGPGLGRDVDEVDGAGDGDPAAQVHELGRQFQRPPRDRIESSGHGPEDVVRMVREPPSADPAFRKRLNHIAPRAVDAKPIPWFRCAVGGLLMGLAVSCHVSSILDVALRNIHEFSQRLWRSLVIFVAVILFIYFPVAWLVGQVASPQRIRMNALPFEAGDVLLVNRTALRWFSPQVGDVVQYEIPRTTVTRRTHGGLNAQVVITGSHIDRILAVGGQQVDCRDGVFRVDGKPSDFRPLNPQWTSCVPELRVPEGQYLIVPSTNPYITPNVIHEICLVPRSRLSGRVYFRTQPLTRFGFIN